jgi:hypothetical protein
MHIHHINLARFSFKIPHKILQTSLQHRRQKRVVKIQHHRPARIIERRRIPANCLDLPAHLPRSSKHPHILRRRSAQLSRDLHPHNLSKRQARSQQKRSPLPAPQIHKGKPAPLRTQLLTKRLHRLSESRRRDPMVSRVPQIAPASRIQVLAGDKSTRLRPMLHIKWMLLAPPCPQPA